MNKPVISALFPVRKMLFRCISVKSYHRPKREALLRYPMPCALLNLTADKDTKREENLEKIK